MSSNIILGENQYGKAEVRVVKITRDSDRHEIEDLNVTSQLRGDFAAAHLEGDNAHVVATDTQKNTIYAFARDGVGSPEAFLLRLGEHFTSSFDWVTGGRWEAESYSWNRIQAHGAEHDHSFVRNGQEVRTAVLFSQCPDCGQRRSVGLDGPWWYCVLYRWLWQLRYPRRKPPRFMAERVELPPRRRASGE